MGLALGILGVLGPLVGAAYAIWRKYRSPEAQLAKLQAEAAAAQAATKTEAERLDATYTRIDKEPKPDAKSLVNRLNRPQS